jgi:formylglycine-generating enzyme required for sulfatase activity
MGEYAFFAGNMIWPGGGRTFADGTPARGVHYHDVGKKKPNAFGLYDMHGGNWEWCADYYDRDYYTKSPVKDPTGPESGRFRTLRGGSWFRYDKYCRSAYRRFFYPASNADGVTAYISDFGCRLVINLDDASTARHVSSNDSQVAKAPFSAERAKELQQHWAKENNAPVVETNSIGMKLTLIPPGEFMMGSTEEKLRAAAESNTESKWYQSVLSGGKIELPSHRVRITKPFYMGSTEVTVAQFREFADATGYKTEAERGLAYGQPANRKLRTWRETFYKQADDHPVLQLCQRDCNEFCKWLSKKEGREYHVPTEAQWEYACRAGTNTLWHFADDYDEYEKVAGEYAWASWDRKKTPHPIPVGQKKPNAFGLYDMHGNVWEYVADWYHEFYFKESPINDPTGPKSFNEMRDGRVMIRGGSFDWADSGARSAIRMRIRQDSNQHPHMGFRVAMKIKDAKGIPPAVEQLPKVRKDSDPAKVKPFDAVAAQKALAEHCDKEISIDLGGDTTMEFVAIPTGTFLMGSADGLRDERPLHKVAITKPFYISKYEVTQGQWQALMGEHPGLAKAKKNPRQAHNVGPNKPMYGVSWTECQQFIAALKKKRPNLHFRLPTEAQWEHACRAGSRTEYHFGDDAAKLAEYALVCADEAPPLRERDALNTTVGRRKPNAYGVYDLHGSMWEWCVDRYAGDYYSAAPVKDPQGPSNGLLRVLRGGSWFRYGRYARAAYRHSAHPDATSSDFGFRVVINAGPPSRRSAQRAAPTKPVASSVDRSKSAINYTKLARSLVRYSDNPVIKVGQKGAWNDQTLGCFTVLDGGDQFYFYSGGAQFGKKKNVGMATSKDGIHWTYFDKNPLFPGSMPYAIKVGETTRLYHPGDGGLQLRTSKDGIHWTYSDKNPLFPGSMPYAIKVGDTFRLYHPGDGGLQLRTSKDGFGWSEPRKVMSGCLDPCVIQVGENKFHLYFCSGGKIKKDGKQVWQFKNYMATSNDGITWTKQPKPVLPLGPEGTWDEGSHAGPCVLKLPDGFHMWYLGSGPMDDKIAWRIGHATSSDGLTWTKSATEPVLDVGKEGNWDGGTFMSFDIIFRDGKFLFWYAAAPTGHEEETKMKIQIGHGTSS